MPERSPKKPATKPPTKPRDPRSADIDFKVVEGMASVGATNVEIAEFIGVAEATIRKHCTEILIRARGSMKTKLRRAQLRTALKGNPAMLIWLGKQMLGQKEKSEINVGPIGESALAELTDDELRALAAGRMVPGISATGRIKAFAESEDAG